MLQIQSKVIETQFHCFVRACTGKVFSTVPDPASLCTLEKLLGYFERETARAAAGQIQQQTLQRKVKDLCTLCRDNPDLTLSADQLQLLLASKTVRDIMESNGPSGKHAKKAPKGRRRARLGRLGQEDKENELPRSLDGLLWWNASPNSIPARTSKSSKEQLCSEQDEETWELVIAKSPTDIY